MNYYNEIDPFAAAWLRELIREGLISNGIVDERDIRDVAPSDLDGFTQCHFFAGIGGWSYALRLAGIPDDFHVWTGSCPCQPFSTAGKGLGTADERHLWPAFRWLIANAKPDDAALFGEQVASKAGRAWFAGVRADLEAMGHVVGAADLCAACVGAPHIRQRLFWVSVAEHVPAWTGEQGEQGDSTEHRRDRLAKRGATGGISDAASRHEQRSSERIDQHGLQPNGQNDARIEEKSEHKEARGIRDAEQQGLEGHSGDGDDRGQPGRDNQGPVRPTAAGCDVGGVVLTDRARRIEGVVAAKAAGHGGSVVTTGFWDDSTWHLCRDGKQRRIPIEPVFQRVAPGLPDGMDLGGAEGAFPLAKKIPGRVMLLRGYGNALTTEVAVAFIEAAMK